MAKAKRSKEGEESSGPGAGLTLPPGSRSAHVLTGHTDSVMSVAFDPQGGRSPAGVSTGR